MQICMNEDIVKHAQGMAARFCVPAEGRMVLG